MNITIEQAKLLKELSEGKKVPLSRLKARIFQQLIQEQVLLRQKSHTDGISILTTHNRCSIICITTISVVHWMNTLSADKLFQAVQTTFACLETPN